MKHDEAVIIHGASGGVGTLAVQFAKVRRARVLAIASGADGVALVNRLGADAAVDGHKGDVGAAIQDFAPDGAYPAGIDPEPKVRRGIAKTRYDAEPGVQEFERLSRAIDESRARVPIAAEFALADVARAHERLAQGHILGKVVLRIA